MNGARVVALAVVLILAPALPGVATRTRAALTGRRGAPVLQLYFELVKLLRKRTVYGASAGWLFRWSPPASLAALLAAAVLVPFDGRASLAGFPGDFLLFAGLLGLARFSTLLAALDTGSSFEGMGASRDAMVSTYAEPGLVLGFGALVLVTGSASLGDMLGAGLSAAWPHAIPALALLATGLFALLLAESGRGPVDDPATHLELTMIHEVAILDHSGPGLAMMLYGSSLRFALLGTVVTSIALPRGSLGTLAGLLLLAPGLLAVAVVIGAIESVMARLRLNRVPLLLVAATALVTFAAILLLGRPS